MKWVNRMSEKRLTEDQFRKAVQGLALAPKTIEMVRAVLIDGQMQSAVAARNDLTPGAVSQAVSKVWEASQVPEGYERVEAVLPAVQAYQVRLWAKAAEEKKRQK